MKVAFMDLISAENFALSKKVEWDGKLDDISEAIGKFYTLDSFHGEAADSARLYMYEVHSYILAQLKVYLSELISKISIYTWQYLTLDSNISAVIDTDTLYFCQDQMATNSDYVETKDGEIQGTLNDISDLYQAPSTSYTLVTDEMNEVGDSATTLAEKIISYDEFECENVQQVIDYEFDIYSLIAEATKGEVSSVGSYKMGDIEKYDSYEVTYEQMERSEVYLGLNSENTETALGVVSSVNEELAETAELEKKKRNSVFHYVKGAGIIVTGVAAVIVTQGAATPVVVMAFGGATVCCAFGGAEFYEATDEVLNVVNNEPYNVACNPIRDTVFSGDQDAYDLAFNTTQLATGAVGNIPNALAGAAEYGIEETGEYVFVATVENIAIAEAKGQIAAWSVDGFEAVTGIEIDDVTKDTICAAIDIGDTVAGTAGVDTIPSIYSSSGK